MQYVSQLNGGNHPILQPLKHTTQYILPLQMLSLMGIHVVEAGGNGNQQTIPHRYLLPWYGNSGAIIVGAGNSHINK